MTQSTPRDNTPDAPVDLAEVARLVEQLEADLALARKGDGDLQTLRDEVERLREALAAADASGTQVHQGLHGLRDRFAALGDELFDDAVTASRYAAWIGRLLGL
ncbi:MAG: hypothetical protein VW339_01100 [Quisquiliibacterium sp.]